MKTVMLKELKLRVKSNVNFEGLPKKIARYLGWLVDLKTQATSLPTDKIKKILDRIVDFKQGKITL